jgi:translation initiation factor 2 subunit 1
MMKKEFPEEGELVIGTVVKVQGFGAFVSLDEYPGREGFIHISEIATGWVKRIRNHVREKQKVVCKVLRVEEAKNHIDLSLKRVNEHQKREKVQEWKNNQKSSKLFEMVAENLGQSVQHCQGEFGEVLIKKYGSLYAAFEECAYDPKVLHHNGFSGNWIDIFCKVAKENITIPFVNIKGQITITSWLPDGIMHIREALVKAEQSEYEDVSIEVKYIGAPRYLITVKAPDYKIAEEQMKKAVERVSEVISGYEGECTFKRDIQE